jgi:hypothetical protein
MSRRSVLHEARFCVTVSLCQCVTNKRSVTQNCQPHASSSRVVFTSKSASAYTQHTQNNGAMSKVNKIFISHLTRTQRTPSAAATVLSAKR